MYPILLRIGDFIIPAWHTFYVLGALAAYFMMIYLARSHFSSAITESLLAKLFIVTYISSYLGARLFSLVIEHPINEQNLGDILLALFKPGSMTFYGGFLAALLSGYFYLRHKEVKIHDILDITLPSGMLGLAIGRIGCFLNGDDYGKVVTTQPEPWWAVRFPNHEHPLPRIPTQLIESLAALLIVIVSVLFFARIRQRLGTGFVACLGTIAYASYRFFAEYWRDDWRGRFLADTLSPSQVVSLILLTACLIWVFLQLKKSQKFK